MRLERTRQVLRFPTAVPRDPAIAAWMREQPRELAAIARRWFEVMRGCGPDVRELLHDDQPTACVGDAAFAYVDAFTAHVNVGFFRGAELADPARLLEGTGRFMRHIKLRPGVKADDAAIQALIASAYADVTRRMRPRVVLVPKTRDEVLAYLETLTTEQRAEVSAAWLAQLHSPAVDAWTLGFDVVDPTLDTAVGQCGFKGPPDAEGVVEIAYSIVPTREGQGYATDAAHALVAYASASGRVREVRAHTLSDANASARVLTKCGFTLVGRVVDPDDGRVWRWARPAQPAGPTYRRTRSVGPKPGRKA